MIRVENLSLEYRKGEPVLENVSFQVKAGQFVSLIGQSGSGKTSILRAIAGLQKPSKGKVVVEDLTSRVGFLFQDDALLPWRTVRENVSLENLAYLRLGIVILVSYQGVKESELP
jgi:NitT/TauT family transport system ATP-binding protein